MEESLISVTLFHLYNFLIPIDAKCELTMIPPNNCEIMVVVG